MSPRLVEDVDFVSESYFQGMADGGAQRHLAYRFLLFARCALGYFLMAFS